MITPESLAKSGTEHGHQAALFLWAYQNKNIYSELQLMFAIPNGGLRGIVTAAMLKAEGVKAGVSDIFLPVARGKYHGLFIEMKKLGGKATKEQLDFGGAVLRQGYQFVVCLGWKHARDNLIYYLTD